MLLLIQNLDQKADEVGLADVDWTQRYAWKDELVDIYGMEETMWQVRGGERWLLEGDANTAYFHGIANGRKRKCMIKSLEDKGVMILESEALQAHITGYYKSIFGSEPASTFKLHHDLWRDDMKVSLADNEALTKPFTMDELEVVVKGLRDGSAPGPDGFTALFFKIFWPELRTHILDMLHDLREGKLELFRLNYGILTLIPKVKGATSIKQYRPICLLNVVYKIITKNFDSSA